MHHPSDLDGPLPDIYRSREAFFASLPAWRRFLAKLNWHPIIDLMVERYAREQEDARRRDRLARWESSPPDDPLLAELNAELHRRGSTTITDLPAQPTDPRPEPADTAPGQPSKRNAAKATLPLVLASVDGCYRSLCRVCSVGFPLAGDLRHPAGRRPAPASLMAPPPSTTAPIAPCQSSGFEVNGLRLLSLPLGSGQVFKRSRVIAQRCSTAHLGAGFLCLQGLLEVQGPLVSRGCSSPWVRGRFCRLVSFHHSPGCALCSALSPHTAK